jgi:hypothetical protein
MNAGNVIPTTFFAGDTVAWLVDHPAYLPADGWAIQADITNANNHYSTTSTDNGDGQHKLLLDTTATQGMVAGDYQLTCAAIKGSERYTLSVSSISIQANPTQAGESRSKVKQTLDAVEAYLLDTNNLKAASYSIAGRDLARYSLTEVLSLRNQLRKDYQREQAQQRMAGGRKPRRRLLTRMRG